MKTKRRARRLTAIRALSENGSARDNGLLAFTANGEGYYSFHHKCPYDFRNGVRWYQGDPAKRMVACLRFAGLARDPRKITEGDTEGIHLSGLTSAGNGTH